MERLGLHPDVKLTIEKKVSAGAIVILLADANTTLRLGNELAARILVSGRAKEEMKSEPPRHKY